MFFLSGSAALMYQVLWVRELGLLLGNTAQAAALTVAVFFSGISAGSRFWGDRAARSQNPLALFGRLELAVGLCALAYFGLISIYHSLYPRLLGVEEYRPVADLLLKGAISATVLFPAAFFMGGTLPAMGETCVRRPSELGHRGSLLYFVNTLGGAVGVLVAGFLLPPRWGFRNTYMLAVMLDIGVGLACLRMAHRSGAAAAPSVPAHPPDPAVEAAHRFRWRLAVIAFVSGFCILGLEVFWTRLFAQVLQNSVYTYALVLTAFLLALATGAATARRLCLIRGLRPETMLTILLATAALVTAAAPWLFHAGTSGLGYVGAGRNWWTYLGHVAGTAALVMFVPCLLLGCVLPFLLRLLQEHPGRPGRLIGRIMAADTVGAIAGALTAGFVLLPTVGATRGMTLLSAVYLLALALHLSAQAGIRTRLAAIAALLMAALLAGMPVGQLRVVALHEGRNETLVEVVEGRSATAAVIQRESDLLIRVNNHYTLGGTGALESERNQALIPLLLHPDPRRIFFLGMGTGITAGAALHYPVERVVVCELLPEVIDLARSHFDPWTNGLFHDERVRIIPDDGRHYLTRTRAQYDLIISDLFTPWEAGTGNLYTLDHYRMAARRLAPGGLYVQWIPAYQVSEREFGMIARTMGEAFEQVLLWRGDLFPTQSILALVGQPTAAPLDPETLVKNGRILAGQPDAPGDLLEAVGLRFYAGNLTASGLYRDAPLNTDNHPRIEYAAPQTQRRVQAGAARWLTGDQLGLLYERLARRPGHHRDPYLAALDTRQIDYVNAGRSYFNYGVYRMAGRMDIARLLLNDFLEKTPFERAPTAPRPTTMPEWEER